MLGLTDLWDKEVKWGVFITIAADGPSLDAVFLEFPGVGLHPGPQQNRTPLARSGISFLGSFPNPSEGAMKLEDGISELRALYAKKDELSTEEGEAWLEDVSRLLHQHHPARADEFDSLTPLLFAGLTTSGLKPIWHRVLGVVRAAIAELEHQSATSKEDLVEEAPEVPSSPEPQSELEDRGREPKYHPAQVAFWVLSSVAIVAAGIWTGYLHFQNNQPDTPPGVTEELRESGPSSQPEFEAGPSVPSPGAGSERVWLTEASPQEIVAYVSSLPPLSRRQVCDSLYPGTWVRSWRGAVSEVRENGDGFRVLVQHADTGRARITGLLFDLEQRALVHPLREGDTIVYLGRILENVYWSETHQVPDGFLIDSVSISEHIPARR